MSASLARTGRIATYTGFGLELIVSVPVIRSCAMDEGHALSAVRYVENNPVAARLCARAPDWSWSSARYHVGGQPDGLTQDASWLSRITDWATYLEEGPSAREEAMLGDFSQSGYPLGSPDWVEALEAKCAARLRPGKPGRPRRAVEK